MEDDSSVSNVSIISEESDDGSDYSASNNHTVAPKKRFLSKTKNKLKISKGRYKVVKLKQNDRWNKIRKVRAGTDGINNTDGRNNSDGNRSIPSKRAGRNLTQTQKELIVQMRLAGVNTDVISAHVGCSRDRVYTWLKRWQESASLERRSVSGRPKAFNKDQENELLELLKNNSIQFLRAFVTVLPYKASFNTVLRRLEQGGYHKNKEMWEESLQDADKEERMSFAMQHLHRSSEEWKHVVFADFAVAAYMSSSNCVEFIPLRSAVFNQPFETKRCIYSCVWVWFSAYGAGNMHVINHSLDIETYKIFLRDTAIPLLNSCWAGRPYLLQQHSTVLQQLGGYFTHFPHITPLEWPQKSADLNPLDFVWETMRDHLLLVNVDDAESLTHKVQDVWDMLQGKRVFWESLVQYVPNSLKRLCEYNGDRLNWGWS